MVYVILVCTLPCLFVICLFLRTDKSTRYRYEKAILYPLSQSNGSKICTWPGQIWGLESVSQILCMCPGPSFIDEYNCGRAEKSFANF